jgi:hypothetical protein
MASANPLQILIPVAANLWLLGILAMGLYTAISYFSLKKKVSTATRLRENIYRSEYIASPFVLGLRKPEIYLPYSIPDGEIAHVIAHEQAHILRKDHWWKPLGFALLAVHLFNPLLWIAYLLLCRDIELACDEKVIAGLDHNRRADYSQALLRCSVTRRSIAACPLAFGEVGVKARVKNVLHYKKPAFWVLVVSVAACAAVAVCFLTDPLTAPPAALPLVHSHSYRTVELLYEAPGVNRDSFINPRFSVTEEMELRMKSDEISYNGWASLGTLSEIPEERLSDFISTRDVRKNAARGWHLRNASTETEFTLIQTKNNELFLNIGVIVPPGGSIKEGYLYRLGLDLTEDYNLLATSGGNVVPLTVFPAGTPIGACKEALHWLTIDPGEDFCPFRVYDNGEEVYGAYAAFDAETYEPLKYMVPSGLDPQTYLFQNADPNRAYIVILGAEAPGGEIRCFGVRFGQEKQFALRARILEVHDTHFLVEPVEGSMELASASRIEVTRKNMPAYPEPQPGDMLQVYYDGQILETYPAGIRNVFSMAVIHREEAEAPVMVPTDCALNGIFDRFLYLTLDGAKYRYERTDPMPGGIQAGELIGTVWEDTGLGISYRYTVFSVKGCVDNTMMLVHSEHTDQMWLYRYSPAEAVDPAELEKAKASGCVVMEDGDTTAGQEVFRAFYEKTLMGIPASVTLVSWYTLDPERTSAEYYEACRQDYPTMYRHALSFNGEEFILTNLDTGEASVYGYLNYYSGRNQAGGYGGAAERYVLTQDPGVTWEELYHSLLSSFNAYIDHYVVYKEN